MIEPLITALSKELKLSAEEIADTIWLALQIQESQSESIATQKLKVVPLLSSLEKLEPEISQALPQKTSDSEEAVTKQPSDKQKAGIYPRNQHQISQTSELSFKVPDAPSLREPLTLARALKPLMRRIPSGTTLVLDEAATTQRIADEGLWLPVLRPTLEPWLDLELVVDESISMQIWRPTIRELERLLKNYGIFRDVRVWGLITDAQEQVQIRRGIGITAKNQPPRSPAELIDPSGRRLVLVVSDCVSSLWRNGGVTHVLELWAKQGSMAIVQMLPKWLWKRTALGRASEVRLQGLTPGVSNQKLIAKEVSLWDELEETQGVKVPVFTLEADKVETWAQMLSGKGSVWTSGYVFKFDANPVNKGRELFNLDYGQMSAEHRVQAFRVTASPMARKLAGLLAAVPVISLPIVRLIQEALLEESQQVHVAEVFLGGLLKPLSEILPETNPNYVQYEFMDGVRELLVDSVPSGYVLNVVDEVSKYVARKVGLSLEEFAAVLRNPQQARDSEIAGEVGYFATVTAQVLRRLGGEYAKFAEELERYNRLDYQRNIQTTLDSFPNIEYQIGGCLLPDSPSYIKRKADDELYNAVKAGQCCILSTPRQTGKTSLIRQARKRLQEVAFTCAIIDFTIIGFNEITQENFYASLIHILVNNFELEERFNLKSWWKQLEHISPAIKFIEFIEKILLQEISQNIVIFFEELDAAMRLNIKQEILEDFFGLLRALHNRSPRKNNYNRLNFVLSGVFLDSELNQNTPASPLTNIAFKINLESFSYEEALPLAGGLAEKTNNPQELLKEILGWTGGQPFLTQKLCSLVKRSEDHVPEGNEKAWLENLVITKIIDRWEEQDNPQHLRTVQDRILCNANKASELLNLYKSILQEEEYVEPRGEILDELKLTGLVFRREGKLRVANRIYAEVFNQEWIEQNLKKLVKLKSDKESKKEIDYTQLRNLLAHQQWKEADEETARLMFKISRREQEKWLGIEDIEQFPSGDLQMIDQLWVKYSNGRFGFSVQKQIYQSLGGTKEFNQKITEAFWQKVGLLVNNQPYWSQYDNLIFNLSAPLGHLPIKYDVETPSDVFGVVEELLSRPDLVFQELENKQPEALQIFTFTTPIVNLKGEIIKTETKTAQYFAENLPNNISLEMGSIPGGTFIMGSPEGEGNDREKPQHKVTLRPFFIGKYPVTQAQWKAVANLPKIKHDINPDPFQFKGDNRPVERVSWDESVEFCDRLSKLTGRKYRLPSEAEWEYACRAGTTTPFCFGKTLTPNLAIYGSNRIDWQRIEYNSQNSIIRPKFANNFGLCDMHGTVWEWCADAWHNNYDDAPLDGSIWLNENYKQKSFQSRFVVRGGSWGKPIENCRSAHRQSENAEYKSEYNGFRVVCIT